MAQDFDFSVWKQQLKVVAIADFGFTQETADTIDLDSYRSYYDSGMTPAEAMQEDSSYA